MEQKQNTSAKVEGNAQQGITPSFKTKFKNESGPESYKLLKKTKATVAIDGTNGELFGVPRGSTKAELHRALIRVVRPIESIGVKGREGEGGVAASPVRREHGQSAGNSPLKEAKGLKHTADRLKTLGDSDLDITGLYFQAALEFFHCASLFETCNAENAKHEEITQSMKVYTDIARL